MRLGRSSRHATVDTMLDPANDRGKESDGDSQYHLWPAPEENGIMKTVSVEVVASQGHGSDEDRPRPVNWPLEAHPAHEIRMAVSPHGARVEEHRSI